MELLKGVGKSVGKEKVILSLFRNIIPIPARAIGEFWNDSHRVEQLSFSVAAVRYLTRLKHYVSFFNDESFRPVLWNRQRLTRQKYRILRAII